MATASDHFSTETEGLREARAAEAVKLADGDAVRAHDRSGGQAARRRPRADAGLQRLDPGPDPASEGGLRDRGQRRQPGRHGRDRPLARPAPREPVRRNPRDPGSDSSWRQLHGPRRLPRPRCVLVPPAHPRGLRPGNGPLRQRHRRALGPRLLAAGSPRSGSHPRRHPARGRQGGALQPYRDHALGDGPLRRSCSWSAARPTSH